MPGLRQIHQQPAPIFQQELKIQRKSTSLSKQEWFCCLFSPAHHTSQSPSYLHHLYIYIYIIKQGQRSNGIFWLIFFLTAITTFPVSNTIYFRIALKVLQCLFCCAAISAAFSHEDKFSLHDHYGQSVMCQHMTFSNEVKIEQQITTSRSNNFQHIQATFLSRLCLIYSYYCVPVSNP